MIERRLRRNRLMNKVMQHAIEALESRTLMDAGGNAGLAAFLHDSGANGAVALSGGGNASTINAPTNLTATAGSTSITLKWTDRSTNESGFKVLRSTDGVNFTQIGSVGKSKTSYADSAVTPGVTYTYCVLAYNSTTTSPNSNTASALIPPPAPPAPPSAPGSLAIGTATQSTIPLTWTDTATNESGYHVYRSTDGVNYTLIASLAANSTSFTDSGLSASTTYDYEVGAWNSAGETLSAVAAATTAASPPPSNTPVTISTVPMVGFTELRIDGSSGNDNILVTQSGGILTITANGQTNTIADTFGDMVIHGISGSDTITVDSSVNIPTMIYAGDGSDVIRNLTTAKATIVTIGSGTSTVTGNGINTAYWVNPGDTVNASAVEISLGGVNRVGDFYQPWTTNTSSPDYISRELYGQNLRDPSDSGATTRLTGNSFWGLGANMNDINQTVLADCYFLAPLSSLAYSEPARLMNMGVDLGDGTYAVRFVRNGVTSFVRVDGDLSTGGWSWGLAYQTPGTDGNLWGSIFEKAYAFFRTGANAYASLNDGQINVAFSDLGISNTWIPAASGATTIMNTINSALNAGKAVVSNTNTSIIGGAPLISFHAYSVIGAYLDTSGNVMIRLRNPWGVDGAGNDGVDDGIVTITYSQYAANFGELVYSLV